MSEKSEKDRGELCRDEGMSDFYIMSKLVIFPVDLQTNSEMTRAAAWLSESKNLMGDVASLWGEITGSRQRRLPYLHYFVQQIKNEAKAL